MTKILVTGGSGRLGRSVVTGLANAGNDVVSLDTLIAPDLPAVQEATDLTDRDSARETIRRHLPDAIIHLAAIAVPFSAPEAKILATNASLAFNVVGSGADLGVRKIITASSPTVIGYGNPKGWIPTRLPIDELEPVRPWNAYALSKSFAESIARMFAAASGDAVRLASFRPCYVITPEEWAGAPTQQGHTVKERLDDPALAAPSLFNYLDARDAADFLVALLNGLDDIPNGETFFVGAKDALARQPLSDLLPRFVPNVDRFSAQLTGTKPAFSIEKATSMLGWVPRREWRTEIAAAAETPDLKRMDQK